ncbi:energy-coupling factor ABC transporter ATP-binding protein [Fictibacillus sp. WQ 8-8]|uniref:energy-coupling factor ABC transporter ATP-binding protein n=1 Tax=unclassified Fictibacillus TaxID=2644029 RepID=UPI000780FE3F|nr:MULTISPECIES: energy-coupling factor ABC transporter ATP-binding protein [unclassified Fictibacillus]MCQ6268415.1 energy-coupling factor ABC transporter ATP-binding protein [Fictibacillus sp. WQ 8-8]MED2974299.1 energy-coupling factor ABC transporter ATP-binding protein [Fictibacillus sp. B-59209]
MKELISVNNVSFQYPSEEKTTLADLSLSVYQGEWLAIVGHNGSGKSTLAKLLNGLLLPSSGEIKVEDYTTTNEQELWEIRRRVGIVFQNPDNQFVGTSVRDDVAFGLENFGVPREEMISRIEQSIQRVKMQEFIESEPHHLSGGQKQRVAIAGIIAQKPSIIILDEATSMLDPMGRKEVIDTVKQLNEEEGITVISITHDLEEAVRADRVMVMKQGSILTTGSPRQVFQNESLLLDAGLDLPFSLKLGLALKENGIGLKEQHLTQEELVGALWTLKSTT